MQRILALLLALALTAIAIPATAVTVVEGENVMYIGGSVPKMKPGVMGKLDMTQAKNLNFQADGETVSIPYANIESFEYTRELARHLGVVPIVAVVLVKHLQRKHYLNITYRDEAGTSQVAVFEISKEMPKTLLPVLQTRAPQGCKSCPHPYTPPASRTATTQAPPPPTKAIAEAR